MAYEGLVRHASAKQLGVLLALEALVGIDPLPRVQCLRAFQELRVRSLRKAGKEDVVGDHLPRLQHDAARLQRRLRAPAEEVLWHGACDDLYLHLVECGPHSFLHGGPVRRAKDPAVPAQQHHPLVRVNGAHIPGHLQADQPGAVDHDGARVGDGLADMFDLPHALLEAVAGVGDDERHPAPSGDDANLVGKVWPEGELDDLGVRVDLGDAAENVLDAFHGE
mmetsp:Transcript_132141/g.410634  ORF Transcript_132141/g.410634 Transcript_132141/m.410634 type:complete len:222 (-) Transcript_132141:329-994(-)